nr:MAG TPA: hypothetical protein [Caudoviricetes sp.]
MLVSVLSFLNCFEYSKLNLCCQQLFLSFLNFF